MTRGVAAGRRQEPAAAAAATGHPSDGQTTGWRSPEACLLKAAELDRRASQAPDGPLRDGFVQMAEDWRLLAAATPPLVNLWR